MNGVSAGALELYEQDTRSEMEPISHSARNTDETKIYQFCSMLFISQGRRVLAFILLR